jgi:excisionase family DNA binding protein
MPTATSPHAQTPAASAAIAVPPAEASRLLSISLSRLYALLRAGELDSYAEGRARRITVPSIHAYIARRLADSAGGWRTWPHNPQARRQRRERA